MAEAETEQTEPLLPPAEVERRKRSGGRSCPVKMRNGKPCGWPIYQAPPGVDGQPVCLMHSKDPNKSGVEFQSVFDEILAAAGAGLADFTGFVFPSAPYSGRAFIASCCFEEATFAQGADFRRATFTHDADFSRVSFTQRASFSWATFAQHVYFSEATFVQDADFFEAKFTRAAHFAEATFTQRAYFIRATFAQAANFLRATFAQHANFLGVMLTQEAVFLEARFAQDADFGAATFKGPARFEGPPEELADKPCGFKAKLLFRAARFEDYADFRGVVFGSGDDSTARPVFSLARFEKPERATFHNCWLGHALFVNCDVSRVNFSDVAWGRRGKPVRLYEEEVPLDKEEGQPLKPRAGDPNERNYRLIGETYHQLKVNYDSKGDPWTAGEFHYGEMEMKRKWSRWRNPALRWLGQHFGLTALYRWTAAYGLSIGRPLAWLAIVLALFTLLYPWVGLRPSPGKSPLPAAQATAPATPLTYRNFDTGREPVRGLIRLWGHSLVTAVGVASLQRDVAYFEPNYGWGRLLALLELVCSTTLLALFLLAVRRQFKR